MLPKRDRELIKKIGRYTYNKMKELSLPLTYEEYIIYEKAKKKEQELKKKMGYKNYNEMKELRLNCEEYRQYKKEQKLKKYEKNEKKIRLDLKPLDILKDIVI